MSSPGPAVDPVDPADLRDLACDIAVDVGAELRRRRAEGGPKVDTKSTVTDLVTELDRWAEETIVDRLLAARPDDGVLGEEGASRQGTSGVTWSIDPIDGTVNFVHDLPGWCVSIAAQVGGRSVAGVVRSPAHDETFTAVLHGGAFLNGRPIRCSEPANLDRSVIGTGFGYDPLRRRRQADVVSRAIGRIADIRRFGAAALDLCWVGCGRLDGYWEVGLNPWDHAAGALVASEAGAVVGGHGGAPASARLTVAAAPTIWADLVSLLEEIRAAELG